jgi:very-short-patch-repair endonuclease
VWDEFRERQHGVVTRRQALAHALTSGMVRHRLRSGRWRRLSSGVYATFTGPLSRPAQLWAAVLAGGPGALLSHDTAAELAGLIDVPSADIHVTVPAGRNFVCPPGVRVHFSIRTEVARHPSRLPPQTTMEQTVIDLAEAANTAEQAISWAIRACARRSTTVDRLRVAFAARKKPRWRSALDAVLVDVESGCQSMLELTYLREVARAHGLPSAQRQVTRARRGGRWYDDVFYADYCTIVELDGQAAHPADARGRDATRDNEAAAAGLWTLRYTTADVVNRQCELAQGVASLLRRNGWRGRLRRCGKNCRLPR